MEVSRRQFLSAALVGLVPKSGRTITGGFVHEAQDVGHRLRDRTPFPVARETRRVPVVIVGGGAIFLATWNIPAPSTHVEQVLPNDRFPR